MNEKKYREGMPDVPARIQKLPVDARGYPIPWFVAEIDGVRDFRVMSEEKMYDAIQHKLCWVCGEKLGITLAFTIGPMCAINRTIAEPPSHRECAEFSVRACPFLNQSEKRRNEAGLEQMHEEHAVRTSPTGLKRQPGAICLWLTRSYKPFYADGPGGEVLFNIGKPEEVFWYCEGRTATRAEVLHSIETGLPLLQEMADQEGWQAQRELERRTAEAMKLVPAEAPKQKRSFASASRRIV